MGKRMYYILKILLESKEESLTREDIVERLKEWDIDINVKTVSATIVSLNEFFYDLIGCDFIKCIKKKGMFIDHELYEDGQLQFILDSIMYHQDLNMKDKDDLKNKLLSFSSFKQQKRLSLNGNIYHDVRYSILVSLSTIIKSIENKKKIRFQYIHYSVDNNRIKEMVSDKEEQYMISPYRIIIQNNHYYLIGYNDKYKDRLSMYRIDRMRNIQSTRYNINEIREQYDMDELVNKMMNMYVSDVSATLVLECDVYVLREVVSRFGVNHNAKKLYDDRYMVTIHDISISEGLIGWIFMLQDKIKVISPIGLKEDIKSRVEKMGKLYNE